MEENKNSQIAEETSSVEQTATQDESVDYEARYNAEVANAKKQRKRAQETEARLKKYTEAAEKAKMEKLAEEGKLTEVVDSLKSQNEKLTNKLSQTSEIISGLKANLLSKLSEEEQEELKDLPFNTLKLVVDKMVTKTQNSNLPNTTPAVNTPVLTKPYSDMTEAEKREHHKQMIEGMGKS